MAQYKEGKARESGYDSFSKSTTQKPYNGGSGKPSHVGGSAGKRGGSGNSGGSGKTGNRKYR